MTRRNRNDTPSESGGRAVPDRRPAAHSGGLRPADCAGESQPVPVVETAAADKNDLTVVRSMELQYANNFAVDYCANGCKIITDGAGQKFLWVPEGERRRTTRGT